MAPSREQCVCDHCGKELIRHNLKKHTHEKHPGSTVWERIVGLMSFDKFVKCINQKNQATIIWLTIIDKLFIWINHINLLRIFYLS